MTRSWPVGPASGAALGVGLLAAVQARLNGQFGAVLGDPLLAGAISLVTGLLLTVALIASRRSLRQSLGVLHRGVRNGRIPRWQLLGGLGGAVFVPGSVALVPRLGVALFLTTLIAGQVAASLLIDRIGFGPGGRRSVSRLRLLGAGITLTAVGLAASSGGRPRAGLPIGILLCAALAVGVAVALQQALVGRLALSVGAPMVATFANFLLATMVVASLVGVAHLAAGQAGGAVSLPSLPWHQWWLMLGGIMGVVFVAVSAAGVRSLGVLVFSVITVAGQLLGALAIDLLLPFTGQQVTWRLVAGVLGAIMASLVLLIPVLSRRQVTYTATGPAAPPA
ncbi:MAG: DMT family transporter [Actinomycetales bacterium]|nr:DMT family transporter [Actinomycetales bacterium]